MDKEFWCQYLKMFFFDDFLENIPVCLYEPSTLSLVKLIETSLIVYTQVGHHMVYYYHKLLHEKYSSLKILAMKITKHITVANNRTILL
jgi:hypothetical protein